MNPRHAATLAEATKSVLDATRQAVDAGYPADRHLAGVFRTHREWGSRDRRFISTVVYSFFRWRGWIGAEPPAMAAALAWSLESAAPHPAQLVLAEIELPCWGGLSLEEKGKALGAWLGRTLAPESLVPDWVQAAVPKGDFASLVAIFQHRPPTWLRVPAGRQDAVMEALTTLGTKPFRHPRLGCAIACGDQVNLDLVRQTSGTAFAVQDVASQCIGLVCAPEHDEDWWDVCAGAGGKTLHLAELLAGTGRVTATDVRAEALQELRRRAGAAGLGNIRSLPAGRYPDRTFDGVLVDAPCSGVGTWSRNPDMRWRTSAAVIQERSAEQKAILKRAAAGVREGGTLVYAVCTTTVGETVDIVEDFRRTHPDFQPAPFTDPRNGIPCHAGSLTLQPWEGPGDGMFVARWTRVRKPGLAIDGDLPQGDAHFSNDERTTK